MNTKKSIVGDDMFQNLLDLDGTLRNVPTMFHYED